MRKKLLIALLISSLSGWAQKRELSYSASNVPVFQDKSGFALSKALVGGLNQPQFQAIDINNDGKKDLLIHDRTGGMILPFINTGTNNITSYVYSPKYVGAFPKIENGWMLLKDYNNDGKEDLWTSIGNRAVLFRNFTEPGDKSVKFRNSLGLMAYNFYPPPSPDSSNFSCDFYNVPTVGDADGDGDIDLFSYQANVGDLLFYRNMTKDFSLPMHPPVFDFADFCWGDFRDITLDSIQFKGCFYPKLYRKHNGGSTLLWFDNDNDGDLDLLMGNAGGKNIIYVKNGKKEFNTQYDSMISYIGHWPENTTPVKMNSFPATFMLDADGDGANDVLVAPNQYFADYPIDDTKQVWFYKNYGSNAFPSFKFEKKNYFTDEFVDHGSYTAPILRDIDGDGDIDLILVSNDETPKAGFKTDRLVLYRNVGTKTKPIFKLDDEDLWGLSQFSLTFMTITFGDLDGDNRQDILAGSIDGDLTFFKNIGSSSTWAFSTPVVSYKGIDVGEFSSPQLIDLTKDGLLDLVIGEREGNFNYYKNTGNTSSPKFTLVDDTLGNFITNEYIYYDDTTSKFYYEGYAAGEIADLDGDDKLDMVFGGLEGKVRVMKFGGIAQATFTEDTTVLFDSSYMRYGTLDFGAKSRPTVADIDGDGIKDIIVGNNRGGINFLKGTVKVLGLTEIHKRNEPLVYPNPADGNILNINKRSAEAYTFSLFDLSGKLVHREFSGSGVTLHEMNIADMSNGVYILQSAGSNDDNFFTRVSVLRGQ